MKILAVIGSPRKKGNTYKAVSQIEEQMKALGDVEFSYLFLRDAHLEPCIGCWQCLSWGEERCPQKDDRERIEKQMLNSDGVIFASPVYAMNVTALMKNFLDRFAYTLHRPRFFKQYTMIICTTGAVGLKETIDRLSVVQFAGFNIVHTLGLTTPPMISPRSKNKSDKKVAEAAQKFHSLIKSGKPSSPRLMNLIAFRAQQASFALAHQYGLADADYKYFSERGWLDEERRYYTDAKVNPLKNLIALIIGKMSRRNMLKELRESAQTSNGSK